MSELLDAESARVLGGVQSVVRQSGEWEEVSEEEPEDLEELEDAEEWEDEEEWEEQEELE